MAYVGRIGGAILAVSDGCYYLVGDLKEPVDFAAHGFAAPAERDVKKAPFVALALTGAAPELRPPLFKMALEGTALAQKLAKQFVIKRNGSVSDRLWRLVSESSATVTEDGVGEVTDACWLGATPDEVWDVVRDGVLRC